MSLTLTNAPQTAGLRLYFSGLKARFQFGFEILCSSNRYARQLDHLSTLSDADLAARGTTRQQECARIMGSFV